MKQQRLIQKALLFVILVSSFNLPYAQSPDHFDYVDSFAATDSTQLRYNNLTFLHGRHHFFLRSGRALMVIQADKVDVGPALNYYLYDAGNPKQSGKKAHAFNFNPQTGNVFSSTIQVIIRNVSFTPFGEQTKVYWKEKDGIPYIESMWWADGIRVTEQFIGLPEKETFERTVILEGLDLYGDVEISVNMMMPFGDCTIQDSVLVGKAGDAPIALTVSTNEPVQFDQTKGAVEIGPIKLSPNEKIVLKSYLLLSLPANEGNSDQLISRAQTLRNNIATPDIKQLSQKWAGMSKLQTKDNVVQEIYDHARFSLDNFATEKGRINAGYLQYNSEWIRDGSNTALGALLAGNFEMARAMGNHMLSEMITDAGVTMIGGGFANPDREQLDQMGEMLHFLRCYVDWTGDETLVHDNRDKILAMVNRPLNPVFMDKTGMVHNRREFWERTFDDAYELIYQTYVYLGLKEACKLAPLLGAEDKVEYWDKTANSILKTMLTHPQKSLVKNNRLIKRRNVTGEIADYFSGYAGYVYDCPQRVTYHHRLMPDATQALPIAFRVIDPQSDLARNTLDDVEKLWNARWFSGGYSRYNSSSEPNQVGPWAFATSFIMRGQHEARLFERSRRSLEYLHSIPGGKTGAWFEEIPATRGTSKWDGIICWSTGEMTLFIIRHYLGIRFEDDQLVIQPALYPNSPPVSVNLRVRDGHIHIDIEGSEPIKEAIVNGKAITPDTDGAIRLGPDSMSGTVSIKTK